MKTYIVLAIFTLLLAACGGSDDPAPSVGCAEADIDTMVERVTEGAPHAFRVAEEPARLASPAQLDPHLRRMIDAQAALDDEDWPECTAEVKQHYADYMTETIAGYQSALDGESAAATEHRRAALDAFIAAQDAFVALSLEDGE